MTEKKTKPAAAANKIAAPARKTSAPVASTAGAPKAPATVAKAQTPAPVAAPVEAKAAVPVPGQSEPVKVEPVKVETIVKPVAEIAKAAATHIETATQAVRKAMPAAQKETNDIMNDTAQKFATEFNDRAKAAMEKTTKALEDLNEFGKGNMEAVVESSKVAAKAAETISQQAAEYGRKSFEQASAAMKSFAAAKSPTELFQLQSDYARSAFDQLIAETSKNSEAFLKLTGDVFQPISNRFAVAAEKIKTVA